MKGRNYNRGQCSFNGCDNYAKVRATNIDGQPWVCGGHYHQQHRGQELRPLRERGQSKINVEGWRRCTKCEAVKPEDEFYRRSTGTRQSRCKPCMIEDASIKQYERKVARKAAERAQGA